MHRFCQHQNTLKSVRELETTCFRADEVPICLWPYSKTYKSSPCRLLVKWLGNSSGGKSWHVCLVSKTCNYSDLVLFWWCADNQGSCAESLLKHPEMPKTTMGHRSGRFLVLKVMFNNALQKLGFSLYFPIRFFDIYLFFPESSQFSQSGLVVGFGRPSEAQTFGIVLLLALT